MLDTLQIPYIYDADSPNQGAYIGDWGSPQVTVHLEVPEGLDPQCIVAVKEGEEITLQTDPAKLAQKTADQWTQVRSQQRDLLYKSDWTCSVTDYEVPNKSEWREYRSRLRDVTTQTDPFNIVWPPAPQ